MTEPMFQRDLLDRIIGNAVGGVVQAATFPIGIKAAYDTVRGNQNTWALDANKWIQDNIAHYTGVPTKDRTLVDEAMSFAGPAAIVTKPITFAGKVGSGILNILNPTTVSGPGVATRAALNTAVPTAVIGGVDAALGGDMASRTWDELTRAGEAAIEIVAPSAQAQEVAVEVQPQQTNADVAIEIAQPQQPTETSGIPTAAKVAIAAGGIIAGAKAVGAISRKMTGPGQIDAATKAYGAVFSPDAVTESALKRTGVAQDQIDRIKSVLHITGNETPRNTKVRHMFETGSLDGYGKISVFHNGRDQTLSGYFNEFVQLDGSNQERIRRALRLGTELDNRNRRLPSIVPGNTNDLRREFNGLLSDPVVRSFLDRYQQFNHQARDYLVTSGLLTRQEANRLAVQNPRYMSYEWADALAKRENFMDRNAIPAPLDLANTDPIRGLGSYWADIIRKAGQNQAKREVMNKLVGINQPSQFVQRVTFDKPTAAWEQPLAVSWRDGGRDIYAVMSDPALASAIRNDPVIGGSLIRWLNSARRLEQSLITGTGATLLGAPFAVTTAIMSGTVGSLTRPTGTSMGIVDNLMQKYLGTGLRGDPTWAIQAVGAFAQDATAQGKLTLARSLARSLDSNGWIAQTFGPQFTRSMADNMLREYEASSLAAMRRLGAAHTSLHGVADESFGAGIGEATDYLKTIAPGVSHPHAAPILRAKAALETVLELIGASANSAFFKQNRGRMSPEVLASATRRLSGDPSEIGSSGFVKNTAAVVPYFNTAMQGMRTVADAATSTPGAMLGGGLVMFGAAPYVYQAYIAALPPEYKDYYWNKLTPADRAGKLFMFLPGTPPELAPNFAIANELAPFFASANRMFGDMLGNTSLAPNVVGDEAVKRAESADAGDMGAAATRMIPGGLPFVVRGPLALAGVDTSNMMRFDNAGASIRPVSGPSIAGTRGRPDSIIDGVLGSYYENLINQIPVLGAAVLDGYKSYWTGEGIGGFIERREMVAADRLSMTRPIWGIDQRLSASNNDSRLLDQRVKRIRDAIDELRDRNKPNAVMQNGVVLEGINPAPMQQHTEMVFATLDKAFAKLNSPGGVLAQRQTEFSNLTRIDSSNISPQEKREKKNAVVERINNLTTTALDEISRISHMLDGISGLNNTVDTLNPGRNIDGTRFRQ